MEKVEIDTRIDGKQTIQELERVLPELMGGVFDAGHFLKENHLTVDSLKAEINKIPEELIDLFAPPRNSLNFHGGGSAEECLFDVAYLATGNLVINDGKDGYVVSGTHYGRDESLSRNMVANAKSDEKFKCETVNEQVVRIVVKKV